MFSRYTSNPVGKIRILDFYAVPTLTVSVKIGHLKHMVTTLVYLYDDLHGCVKEKLPFTIPWWVIANTLTILQDQKSKNDSQNAHEMEKAQLYIPSTINT